MENGNGEYDDCRYTENKVEFARKWILNRLPKVDLDNPKNIVDRICKYKLDNIIENDIPYIKKMTDFSDKVGVYDVLKNMGLDDILLPCETKNYSRYFCKNILDLLDSKEEKFIIKCNHGSGFNVKYTPNSTNKDYICSKMNEWLNINYAYISGYEIQYKWIRPRICHSTTIGG